MKTFYRLISNLVCVDIDRGKAIDGWNKSVEGLQRMKDWPDHMASYFYRDNWNTLQRQKAVLGILGHRSTRGWNIYRLKEGRHCS